MTNINNVHIEQEIGRGLLGTIYLATRGNKKFAYKIEQIFDKDVIKSYKSPLYREIDFATKMHSLYPLHFMKLYDWKIDDKCSHKQDFSNLEHLPKNYQKYYQKLALSKKCVIKLYSYVDTTLNDFMWKTKKFNYAVFYDFVIQIFYVVYLMNKHGYMHNDFHSKNIGLNKTTKKYITIFGNKILTHGYYVVALDYGTILHKKYDLKKSEKNILESENDMFTLANRILFSYRLFFSRYKKEFENINVYNKYVKLKINKDVTSYLNQYIVNLNLTNNDKLMFLKLLYMILYYNEYEKYLLGNKLGNVVKPMYLLPIKNILYIISNIYDIKKIINYMINNHPNTLI
jgi:hypothetical protein